MKSYTVIVKYGDRVISYDTNDLWSARELHPDADEIKIVIRER